MVKRWSEVEKSKEYLSLSPQDKTKAKKQYWEETVVSKINYISLDAQSKQKAKEQFFGGTLKEDVQDEEINVPLETIKGTAKTLGSSAGKLIDPLLHPVETIKGLGFAFAHPIQTAKTIGEDYSRAYGGVENIAETVAEDPLRFLTDVSLVGGIASGGLKTAGRLAQSSKGAKLIEAGQFPTVTQGRGLQTFQQGAEKAKETIGKLRKSPQKIADEATAIYREILNPGKGEIKAIEIKGGKDINKYYRLAAEEGIPIKQTIDVGNSPKLNTLDAIEVLKPKVSQIHNQLDDLLRNQTKTFNLEDISNSAKKALPGIYKNADELRKATRDIDRYISSEIRLHGDTVNAITLNKIKQGMWSVGYNDLRPTAKQSARILGNKIKNVIEDSFPAENIRALNKRSGDYQGLVNLLEEANGRIVQGGKIGKYFSEGTGALLGALGGSMAPIPGIGAVAGGLAGRGIGRRVYGALNDPSFRSTKAAQKMKTALGRFRPEPLKAEPVLNIPVSNVPRIGRDVRLGLPYGKRFLPAPKDVPYKPTGFRSVGERPIVTPNELGQGTLVTPLSRETSSAMSNLANILERIEIEKRLSEAGLILGR